MAPAAGDGDPASDYLLQRDTFTPYPPPAAASVRALAASVATVWAHGDRLKVAVVATPQDLGAVPSLFGRPAEYARFLSIELSYVYRGPLLVAMPAGFGFVRNTSAVARADAVLHGLPVSADPAALTDDAAAAVGPLEAAGVLHVADVTAPVVSAATLQARRGRRVFLRYSVSDDSRTARATVVVATVSGSPVVSFARPFAPAVAGAAYGVVWRVPRKSPRTLALCVRAVDRAGNRSKTACARVIVS